MKLTKVEILRASVKQVVAMLANRRIPVTQVGNRPYVEWDKKTLQAKLVNIPSLPDDASEDLITAVQGFVDHEVGHILYTDAKTVKAANKMGIGGMANMIEDIYIEREMKKLYKGSKKNLTDSLGFVLDKLITPKIEEAKEGGAEASDLSDLTMMPAFRAWSGDQAAQKYMDDNDLWPSMDKFTEVVGDISDDLKNLKNSQDCLNLAALVKNRLAEAVARREDEPEPPAPGGDEGQRGQKKPPEGHIDDEEETDGGGGSGEGSGDGDSNGDGESSESEESDEGESEESESDESEDEESEESDEGKGEDEGEESEESGKPDPSESEEEGEEKEEASGAGKDDETSEEEAKQIKALLDSTESVKDMDESMAEIIMEELKGELDSPNYWPLTKEYDLIEQFNPNYPNSFRTEAMQKEVMSMMGMIQKRLERAIAAKSHSHNVPGHRSGRIHGPSLFRLQADDDRVFSRRHVMKTKEAAVQLVVDCSGSMCGRKIRLAMECAFALCQALDRLNISNQVVGFTTLRCPEDRADKARWMKAQEEASDDGLGGKLSRIEPIHMPIFKNWNQRFTADRREAMANYEELHLRNNVDGESIQYAARMLVSQPKSRHIMIVLSDGFPAAIGNRGDLRSHLKRVIEDLGTSGIDVFGIGIMTNAVEKFYPNCEMVHALEDLPTTVMKRLEESLLRGY